MTTQFETVEAICAILRRYSDDDREATETAGVIYEADYAAEILALPGLTARDDLERQLTAAVGIAQQAEEAQEAAEAKVAAATELAEMWALPTNSVWAWTSTLGRKLHTTLDTAKATP